MSWKTKRSWWKKYKKVRKTLKFNKKRYSTKIKRFMMNKRKKGEEFYKKRNSKKRYKCKKRKS